LLYFPDIFLEPVCQMLNRFLMGILQLGAPMNPLGYV